MKIDFDDIRHISFVASNGLRMYFKLIMVFIIQKRAAVTEGGDGGVQKIAQLEASLFVYLTLCREWDGLGMWQVWSRGGLPTVFWWRTWR
jgi:hypothetical protein